MGYHTSAIKKFGCVFYFKQNLIFMENSNNLTRKEMRKIDGGRISLPIGFGGILLVADAIKAYYEGVEEGCKCALENKKQ